MYVQALLDQHALNRVDDVLLAEGLCLHLDACCPDEALPAAWVELAKLLLSSGSAVLHHFEQNDTAKTVANHSPGRPGQTPPQRQRQHSEADVSGSSVAYSSSMSGLQNEQHADAQPSASADASPGRSQALQQWQALQEVLTPRARDWAWQHFEPAGVAAVEASLSRISLASPTADSASLAAASQHHASIGDMEGQLEAALLQLSHRAVVAACTQGASSPYLARVQAFAESAACAEAEFLVGPIMPCATMI